MHQQEGQYEQVRLTLSNGALTNRGLKEYIKPKESDDATLTCWLTNENLVKLVIGQEYKKIDDIPNVQYNGEPTTWETLTNLLITPNPAFEIVTPKPEPPK